MIVEFFKTFLKTVVGAGIITGVAGPAVFMIIGYARDSVRLFNIHELQKALEISYVDNAMKGGGKYPNEIIDLVKQNHLKEYPQDPIKALDFETLNKLVSSLGVPNEYIGLDVIEENGYILIYKTEDRHQKYEMSVKFESSFFKGKMQIDGGNDDERYEIGNKLNIDTSFTGNRQG